MTSGTWWAGGGARDSYLPRWIRPTAPAPASAALNWKARPSTGRHDPRHGNDVWVSGLTMQQSLIRARLSWTSLKRIDVCE